MIVCKFGGTSVADAACVARVCDLAAARRPEGCLVVVSAMARVTRRLLALGRLAEAGELPAARRQLGELFAQHREVAAEVADAARRAALDDPFAAEEKELGVLLAGIRRAGRLRPVASDRLLAAGELLSSRILAAALASREQPVAWIDPRELVATDERFGEARPDQPRTAAACERHARAHLAARRLVVTGGFVGVTRRGDTTTLGWDGSDTSAALLAAALGAELLEVFKDVDGVYTADPRSVPGARLVPHLSYREAAELTLLGAQVLHYATIPLAARAGTAVRVRNTFRPEAPGTLIRGVAGVPAVRGLAAAGPMSATRLPGRYPCHGLNGGSSWPSQARRLQSLTATKAGAPAGEALTWNGDAGERVALLSLVGASAADVAERAAAALAGRGALHAAGSRCDTHLSVLVPLAEAPAVLADLHQAFFSGPESSAEGC
ncbi:MAG TPA: aspartate kinase [Thermoanaerobaculia bacterium]|nr:aspartate kinase [Thermoanaerobaculia bacterium]